jgi:hypothetical protein
MIDPFDVIPETVVVPPELFVYVIEPTVSAVDVSLNVSAPPVVFVAIVPTAFPELIERAALNVPERASAFAVILTLCVTPPFVEFSSATMPLPVTGAAVIAPLIVNPFAAFSTMSLFPLVFAVLISELTVSDPVVTSRNVPGVVPVPDVNPAASEMLFPLFASVTEFPVIPVIFAALIAVDAVCVTAPVTFVVPVPMTSVPGICAPAPPSALPIVTVVPLSTDIAVAVLFVVRSVDVPRLIAPAVTFVPFIVIVPAPALMIGDPAEVSPTPLSEILFAPEVLMLPLSASAPPAVVIDIAFVTVPLVSGPVAVSPEVESFRENAPPRVTESI